MNQVFKRATHRHDNFVTIAHVVPLSRYRGKQFSSGLQTTTTLNVDIFIIQIVSRMQTIQLDIQLLQFIESPNQQKGSSSGLSRGQIVAMFIASRVVR